MSKLSIKCFCSYIFATTFVIEVSPCHLPNALTIILKDTVTGVWHLFTTIRIPAVCEKIFTLVQSITRFSLSISQ